MICTTRIRRDRIDIFLPVKTIQQSSPEYCLAAWGKGKQSSYVLRYLQTGWVTLLKGDQLNHTPSINNFLVTLCNTILLQCKVIIIGGIVHNNTSALCSCGDNVNYCSKYKAVKPLRIFLIFHLFFSPLNITVLFHPFLLSCFPDKKINPIFPVQLHMILL